MQRGIFVSAGGMALMACALMAWPQGVMAEPTREAVMSGAARCAGIADNRVWLDCFYGSAQPMRAVLGLAPAPAAQVGLVPPPGAAYVAPNAAKTEKSDGFLAGLLGSTGPVAGDMPMASYKFDRDGMFTVVLKNGQTYRQKESDLVRAKWNGPAARYLVTVTSAGADYVLRVDGDPGVTFHVRRM